MPFEWQLPHSTPNNDGAFDNPSPPPLSPSHSESEDDPTEYPNMTLAQIQVLQGAADPADVVNVAPRPMPPPPHQVYSLPAPPSDRRLPFPGLPRRPQHVHFAPDVYDFRRDIPHLHPHPYIRHTIPPWELRPTIPFLPSEDRPLSPDERKWLDTHWPGLRARPFGLANPDSPEARVFLRAIIAAEAASPRQHEYLRSRGYDELFCQWLEQQHTNPHRLPPLMLHLATQLHQDEEDDFTLPPLRPYLRELHHQDDQHPHPPEPGHPEQHTIIARHPQRPLPPRSPPPLPPLASRGATTMATAMSLLPSEADESWEVADTRLDVGAGGRAGMGRTVMPLPAVGREVEVDVDRLVGWERGVDREGEVEVEIGMEGEENGLREGIINSDWVEARRRARAQYMASRRGMVGRERTVMGSGSGSGSAEREAPAEAPALVPAAVPAPLPPLGQTWEMPVEPQDQGVWRDLTRRALASL